MSAPQKPANDSRGRGKRGSGGPAGSTSAAENAANTPTNIVKISDVAQPIVAALDSVLAPPAPEVLPGTANALAEQLEYAVSEKEKALAELEEARRNAQARLEALALERDAINKTGETLSRELEKLREEMQRQRLGFEQQLQAVVAERDAAIRERKESLAHLAKEESQHKQQLAGAGRTAEDFSKKLADVSTQFSQAQKTFQERIALLNKQREAAETEREAATAQAAREQAAHQRELEARALEREKLVAQREEIAVSLAEIKRTSDEQIAFLTTERDAAIQEREALRADLAEYRREADAQIAAAAQSVRAALAQQEDLRGEWTRMRADFENQTAALIRERDQLIKERDELLEYRDVTRDAHKRDLQTREEQVQAMATQRDQAVAAVSAEREFQAKQSAAIARERDSVLRERDQALEQAAAQGKVFSQELATLADERDAVVQQRDGFSAQLEHLRAAHRKEIEALRRERDSLIDQRADVIAQLDRFTAALGDGRSAALREEGAAVRQLVDLKSQHAADVETFNRELAKIARERDEALAQIEPLTALRETRVRVFGEAANCKYEVGARVESDATGIFLRAKDGIAGREVLMKLASDDAGAASDATRDLLREARTLARLDHPGIPPLYEMGLDENGRAFYTVRGAKGKTLRQILDELEQGRTGASIHFTLRRLLGIFLRACDALVYAHSQGVTHGSLQPGHILIGECGEVLVTGWSAGGNEVFTGERTNPEPDVRALGAILYEMVVLARPPDQNQIAREKAREGAKPSRAQAVRQAELHGSDGLAKILLRAAEKAMGRHGQRPHFTVRELQRDVDAFGNSFDDSGERMTGATFVAILFSERKGTLALLGILFLVALTVFGVWFAKMHGNRVPFLDRASAAPAETAAPAELPQPSP